MSCGDDLDRDDPVAPSPAEPGQPGDDGEEQPTADGEIRLTHPESDPFYSNSDTLKIAGKCPDGFEIRLSGDATDEQECRNGKFKFKIRKTRDGTYHFEVQGFSNGNETNRVDVDWIRDTRAPSRPVLKQPKENPFHGPEDKLKIKGRCEPFASVFTRGPEQLKTRCSKSGTFWFKLDPNGANDGPFEYRIFQKDRAGNVSKPLIFVWIIDTAPPPVPEITHPEEDPVFTSEPRLTVRGECTCSTQDCVHLRGDFSDDTSCSNGAYRFDLEASSPGKHSIEIFQEDRNGRRSAEATLTWIFDPVSPEAPSITEPVSVPPGESGTFESRSGIRLRGRCENGATVILEADPPLLPGPPGPGGGANEDNGDTPSDGGPARQRLETDCENSRYSFRLQTSPGTTVELRLFQRDESGSRSDVPTRLTWTRNPGPPTDD